MFKMKKLTTLVLSATLATSIFSSTVAGNGQTVLADTKTPTKVTLIEGNSQWKYEDSNTSMYGDATKDFRNNSFNDSSWKVGRAPLGYPATDNNQTFGVISNGTLVNNASGPNAFITYYFKKDFTVEDLSKITKLEATVGIDDGFVMYINGTEVNRTYMNDGEITHSTAANLVNEPSDATGSVVLDLTSKLSALTEGTNKIAVSVHNRDNNSSDIYFDMNLIATYGDEEQPSVDDETTVNPNKVPKQVNVHIGDNASTSANFTYTTMEESPSKVVLNKVGDANKITFEGTSGVGTGNKYFHGIAATGLEPNTQYEYIVGDGLNTANGTFKTAPAKGSKDSFKFVYIADTQVSNDTNAKALGANLEQISKLDDVDFVYLAGDQTDTAANESQWENLFYNNGAFPNGGQNMFSNKVVAVVQGNHDNNTMNRHINAPAQEGNIVYSFDYGPAKFVMLNLEAARSDYDARDKQQAFLREKVAEAKAAGQWTIVGFHKSLYTGASHITDSDIVDARKYWSPIFAELDIDLVLQGHDHVYSRGFVTAEGQKADVTKNADGSVQDPRNVPLYMVGGHAGGLKWYSKKNYTVTPGDPLAPNYSFLDVNSTDTQSDVKQEQWSTEIEVSNNKISINTYAFKYNTNTDTVTTNKYLYDSLDITRNVASADITGSDLGVADINQEVSYTASLRNIESTNAFNMEVEYDPNVMEFVKAESLLDGTILSQVKNENNKASIIVGTQNLITNAGNTGVAKFTFKMKKTAEAGTTNINLTKAASAQAVIENGKVIGALDTVPDYDNDKVTTEIYTYSKASDINGDGKVTLADLSIALANYQGTDKKCDIDLDGVVNTKDFIIISNKIAS